MRCRAGDWKDRRLAYKRERQTKELRRIAAKLANGGSRARAWSTYRAERRGIYHPSFDRSVMRRVEAGPVRENKRDRDRVREPGKRSLANGMDFVRLLATTFRMGLIYLTPSDFSARFL